jgi:glyoxylase-like metal-dependent hydrolase (beta-lactamase superfamily II)
MRIFREININKDKNEMPLEGIIIKLSVFVPDRPGSLAELSSMAAALEGNISFFYYNRSEHSNKVTMEVRFSSYDDIESFLNNLKVKGYINSNLFFEKENIGITSIENILEIKVRLRNFPGALAGFAQILKSHGANVIFMLYDEDIDEESATISMAVKDPTEIDSLLNTINSKGYHYRIVYKGKDNDLASHIIGLKLAEKFFFQLKKLLPSSAIEEIKSLVTSSDELYQDLLSFYHESGKYLEAGDVYEKVLTLGLRCRNSTGIHFKPFIMPVINTKDGGKIYGLKMPTSENVYVIVQGDEIFLIDSGHGLYYEDLKAMLRNLNIAPESIKAIFITHADTDHIGTAGYFEAEYGTKVYVHHDAMQIIESINRGIGLEGRLANLNRYYTRLSATLTDCKFPKKPLFFNTKPIEKKGIFNVIDQFQLGSLSLKVLAGLGGHIKGQVFFLCEDEGMLFASDYIINYKSLLKVEIDHLGTYSFMLINPNSNISILKEEIKSLKSIASEIDRQLTPRGKRMLIMPGHGEYFTYSSESNF